jgi:hypothetical protein
MNGFDHVRVPCERLEGGGIVGLQQVTHRGRLRLKIGALPPSQLIRQVAPHPLNRVQLRTRGRPPDGGYILGPAHALGGMRAAVLQPEHSEAIRTGVGEGLHKDLAGLRMPRRSFEQAALPRSRGHRALDIEPFEDVLDRSHGLDPTGREAPSTPGESPHAAFIWTTHPHRAGMLGRDDTRQPRLTGGLQRLEGVRVFWGDWAAGP